MGNFIGHEFDCNVYDRWFIWREIWEKGKTIGELVSDDETVCGLLMHGQFLQKWEIFKKKLRLATCKLEWEHFFFVLGVDVK